jgi:septal ring factor EnvC (AmiA/AmiB activator)
MNLPELSKAVSALTEKVNALFTGKSYVNAEQMEAVRAEITGITDSLKAAEQLAADLSTAKQSIATVTAQREALETKVAGLEAEVADVKAKAGKQIADKEAEVAAQAAAKAAQIARAQGIPALPISPDAAAGVRVETLDSVREQMRTEKDPIKKHALAMQARKLRGHENLFKPKQ